jgi:hypothetical protein
MKKFTAVLLLLLLSANAIFPCGPGYVTPLFDSRHKPEDPYKNFAAGKIGILKPSFRRVVLFAAYRYLNNGTFTADEQKSLVDVWNMEFNNKGFEDNDVGEAVKKWTEKRKEVIGKEEKIPEIYAERSWGGYDFFPNCTKNAFETATETLSDRIASHGSDNKDVKDWLAAQDKVFTNCASGKLSPDAPAPAMPEWLQKDRAYQIAAAEFYSLDYEQAKDLFREISADPNSPWQDTANYLVGRTLIRQASLTKDAERSTRFYGEAERHLQNYSGKYRDSAEKLLNLIKYRLYPKERVGDLARNLSFGGAQNFRQDLIDYNWLLDKFEKETLESEQKRKEELKPKNSNSNVVDLRPSITLMPNTSVTPGIPDPNTVANSTPLPVISSFPLPQANLPKNDGDLEIYIWDDDYKRNWRIYLNPNATDGEAIAEAEKIVGMPLTEKMKESFLHARKNAYATRYSDNYQSDYQGGYYGEEKTSLSILPEFLRRENLTDWLFTFQIKGAEAYLYSLSKFKQTGADLWLMTALSKADKNSSELNRLLEAAGNASPSSPAYPTIAYHTVRILVEQNKLAEARKMLDEILDSSDDLPVSSRNQFLSLRMKLAETLGDFLKFAQRKAFAFDWDGTSGRVEEFIAEQKSWYNAETYAPQTREEYDREIDEAFKEERLWQDRAMFDDKTTEIINEHFPLSLLAEAERSPALPDYLRKRFAIAIWTRAILLDDFQAAAKIAPHVIKFLPETEDLMNKFLIAKTPAAKKHAALYLILKIETFTPYISSGMGTAGEGYKMYASRWWCEPYEGTYDDESGSFTENNFSQKPAFLSQIQSDAAQKELRKLKAISDAPKFLAAQVLEWARLSPLDKRVPESLYIVYEANGWDKYGCGNNTELQAEIGAFLKKRYPNNEWTVKILDEESGND